MHSTLYAGSSLKMQTHIQISRDTATVKPRLSRNRAVPDAVYQPTDGDLCTDETDPGRGECAL